MIIKKMYQGSIPENKILNIYSNSQTDVYSCDYINKLNTYSAEEQRIGTWRGKPLYRKVISFATPEYKTQNYITLDTQSLNIDWLINAYGPAKNTAEGQLMLLSDNSAIYLTPSGYIDLYFNNSTAEAYAGYLTIEYTKTTD